jgi:hypothetical protein
VNNSRSKGELHSKHSRSFATNSYIPLIVINDLQLIASMSSYKIMIFICKKRGFEKGDFES